MSTVVAKQPASLALPIALKPLYYTTVIVGDWSNFSRPRYPAIIFGLLWLMNISLYFSYDFYQSVTVFGYTWATVQGLHFLALCLYTFFTTRSVVPWIQEGLLDLQKDGSYDQTIERVVSFTKKLPPLLIVFGLICASVEYVVLMVDKALHVDFGTKTKSTSLVVLHIVKFLNTFHVYLAFGIFWNIPVCVMLMAGYSMKEYMDQMGGKLRSKVEMPTFKGAIKSYSERANFVKKSSAACMVCLTLLLVTNVLKLGVNAYIFLFQKRMLLHIWHALLPLGLMVYPLCTAAWVTKQYHCISRIYQAVVFGFISFLSTASDRELFRFIIVVVRAWVERDDSDDEEEELVEKEDDRTRMYQMNRSPRVHPSPLNCRKSEEMLNGATNMAYLPFKLSEGLENINRKDEKDDVVIENHHLTSTDGGEKGVDKSRPRTPVDKLSTTLFTAARALGKFRQGVVRPKFNFDKFLSYLESMRAVVGFSIGGIIVTWDLVSTTLFLVFSLVAVFVQESIFGSQKSTLSSAKS